MTAAESENQGKKRKGLIWLFTLFLVLLGIALSLIWFFYWQYHETTDDAYANGSLIAVNSAIDGSVIAFYADDTDLVVEGQLLVRLDPTYYQAAFDRALADLKAETLQVAQLHDAVLVNQAALDIKKVTLSKAEYDHENRSRLITSKAISGEDFVHSRDDLTIAEGEVRRAEYQLKASVDAMGTTPLSQHPRLEEKKNALKEAYYRLRHTYIYAPATGYIAQRSVNVGQTAAPGRRLMSIIPAEDVWVDANFKETQLKYMRIGQPATVWFDQYGSGVKFEGKVLGIASGSGSVFSLIPPQNATGNWIKIVQRLAVRISLDPEIVKKYPIRLGISAEVDVDITNQDLPRLAETPPTESVAKTDVFEISFEGLEKTIAEIVNGLL